MSFFVKHHTPTSQAIENKLNAVISGSDKQTAREKNTFKIISSNRAKFNEILAESGNKKVIEVADYGLKPNRDIVKDSNLVSLINFNLEDLDADPQKINFNKIDGCRVKVAVSLII